MHPHIGTIGTAPQNAISAGADSAVGQGSYGGNMDVRDVCRGNKIMLPVFHEGAYLYAGDVHASQADSEFTGSADESRSEVTLSCEIDPGKHIPAPRIETPTSIIQLHSFRPLEDAVQQAFFWLIDWLVTDYGWSPRDAYMQMSVNPDVRIHVYQMVKIGRIHYTAGVEIPKKYLSLPHTGDLFRWGDIRRPTLPSPQMLRSSPSYNWPRVRSSSRRSWAAPFTAYFAVSQALARRSAAGQPAARLCRPTPSPGRQRVQPGDGL